MLRLGRRPEQRPAEIVVDEATGAPYDPTTYRHVFAAVRAAALAGIVDREASARDGRNDPEPVWLMAPCKTLLFKKDDGVWSYKRDQDYRDTGVTWLARAGATMAEICAISGHSPKSVETVVKHYLGSHAELADNGIDKLVAWMQREGIAV